MSNFDGVLTPPAGWPDIPQASNQMTLLGGAGGPLNAQAESLAARTELLKGSAKKSGAFVVFDDATATVATTLIPIANSVGIPYGLAVYMSGIAAAYTSVRIEDILDYKMRYGIEVLNHSSNSEVLNSAMAETYGASLIKTSKQFFDQCAFEPCGFVAPNSVLDSKFVKYVSDNHDFSFVSSVGVVADSASVNTATSDFYNLKRVSLEASGMTLAKAKQLVDYVMDRQLGEYVVFYTHTDTGWVEDLLEYIRDRSAVMIPTAWVSQYRTIRKLNKPLYSPNLLTNSALLVGNTSVEGWSVINQTFDTFNMATTASNNGNMLDFTGTASAAGQTATISQNYFISGGLLKLSVFNASTKTHGLKPSNTKLEIGIFVKNASNATIASTVKEYDVSSGEQVTDVTMGVINSNLISYILVQYKIISVGAGSIRLLMTEPKLAMAGAPVPYNATTIAPYRSVLRRVTALSIPPNTPTKVIYDQRLTGSDGLYNLATGDFVGVKGVWYKLDAQVGLTNMTDGDRVILKFLVGATLHYQAVVKCSAGDNSIPLSFPLHFSGGTEVITLTIEHNSSATRGILPFNTTSLAITSV